MHDNREVEKDSLYRNEYSEGWTRHQKPEGWKRCTDEIYNFFDNILHSLSINKKVYDDDSDDGRQNNNTFGGFGGMGGMGGMGGFGGMTYNQPPNFGWNPRMIHPARPSMPAVQSFGVNIFGENEPEEDE
jgi:hypothetical protein